MINEFKNNHQSTGDIALTHGEVLQQQDVKITVEQLFDDAELVSFLLERGVSVESIEPSYPPNYYGEKRNEPLTIVRFLHNQHSRMPEELPDGYAYMGGVAREAVLKELGHQTTTIRDIDIVGIKEYRPDYSHAADLSKRLMPDDSQFRHGVAFETISHFFSTRDFRLNEVFVIGDEIVCTPDALKDLKNKIIHPSHFEQHRWFGKSGERNAIRATVIMKALRFQLKMRLQYYEAKIGGIEEWRFKQEISAFELALALKKAYKEGDPLATRYLTKILELGVVKPQIQGYPIKNPSLRELTLFAQWGIAEDGKDPFVFNNELDEQMSMEELQLLWDKAEGSPEALYAKCAELANTYVRQKPIGRTAARERMQF